MKYTKLGNSDLNVSRICMGCMGFGDSGRGQHSWTIDEEHTREIIRRGLDLGVNFFDTADTYGLGQSELTLGRALGSRRSEAVIATKFGVRVENRQTFYDNSPQWIRTACENSLRRLGTDYIDLYQIHYRDGKTDIHTVLDTLEDLRREGKIRYFGLSNLTEGDLWELQGLKGRFASIQNQYSLASREQEEDILTLSRELELNPLTWGSLGQGVLTGKYDRTAVFGSDDRRSREIYVNFHGEKLLKNLETVEHMRPIAAAHGKPLSALAVRFILDYLPDSVVLCGVKRPEQILDNAEALGWHLTRQEVEWLEAVSR
jgi:aryl-alcohol dehydrogenase-like predicted oxidoreductase